MEVEQIFPGIYLTLNESIWTPEKLRSHGFTHIIRIDKHILHTNTNDLNSNNILPTSSCPTESGFNSSFLSHELNQNTTRHHHHRYPNNQNGTTSTAKTVFDGFDTLDLNFGAASYLTTVLPNCYKAVKFIDKALQNGGAVLIIDTVNNEKCMTIVVGFLMYKKEIKFSNAFQLVKQIHPNLELDKFYVTQLHEYEPILQVQRTFSYGNSCSRELRSSSLKRKVSYDDLQNAAAAETIPQMTNDCSICWSENCLHLDNSDVLME